MQSRAQRFVSRRDHRVKRQQATGLWHRSPSRRIKNESHGLNRWNKSPPRAPKCS